MNELEQPERVDLHTHSNCSDGALEPAALVAMAAERRVGLLALTDHDTAAGCEAAAAACQRHGVRFVPGVELSCRWREDELHVVGLDIDPLDGPLRAHCERVRELRRARIRCIGRRLNELGLPGVRLAEEALAHPCSTRAHLAQALCRQGFARSLQDAFDRYLGRAAPAYASAPWPELAAAVLSIRRCGGVAVLAHPHRYGLSEARLRELFGAFRAAGGRGAEVSLAGMGAGAADHVAALTRRFGLAGSIGSDFHTPGLPWRPLGRFAKLPQAIEPITTCLGL